MQLSSEALEAFKKIYEKHFGVRLSDSEAKEKALQLLLLLKVVYRR